MDIDQAGMRAYGAYFGVKDPADLQRFWYQMAQESRDMYRRVAAGVLDVDPDAPEDPTTRLFRRLADAVEILASAATTIAIAYATQTTDGVLQTAVRGAASMRDRDRRAEDRANGVAGWDDDDADPSWDDAPYTGIPKDQRFRFQGVPGYPGGGRVQHGRDTDDDADERAGRAAAGAAARVAGGTGGAGGGGSGGSADHADGGATGPGSDSAGR